MKNDIEDKEEKINIQIRKFLKKVGINSHGIIETKCKKGKNPISISMTLKINGEYIDEYKTEIKL